MAIYRAASDSIELITSDARTAAFLDSFLDRVTPGQAPLGQTLSCPPVASITLTGEVLADPARVTHGTVCVVRAGRDYRVGRRAASVPIDMGEAWGVLRKLIREIWLANQAPDGEYYYLHSSAVDDGRNVIVFTGDKRAGKTTLMLDAVTRHGYSLVTNDGLVFLQSHGRYVMAPLPTLAKIRSDVAQRYLPFLAGRLDPFNQEQLARWQVNGSPDRDNSLFLTFGALGQKFACVPLAGRNVVLAGVRFTDDGGPVTLTGLPPEGALALVRRNRKDVCFTFAETTGLPDADATAAKPLLDEIVKHATAMEFQHAGQAGPVLRAAAR